MSGPPSGVVLAAQRRAAIWNCGSPTSRKRPRRISTNLTEAESATPFRSPKGSNRATIPAVRLLRAPRCSLRACRDHALLAPATAKKGSSNNGSAVSSSSGKSSTNCNDAQRLRRRRVLPPYDSVPGALIQEIFHAAGVQPPRPSVATIELTSKLISEGRYVGLLPRSVVRFSGKRAGLKTRPARFDDPHIAVGIVTVKSRSLSPLAVLFIKCAKEFTSMPWNRQIL